MSTSIFSKIIAGDIPCHKVYEDEKVFAFLDINPVNHGHVLVIPKVEYPTFTQTPDSVLDDLILAVKKIGQAVLELDGVVGFNIMLNNGSGAGQEIFHTHFHIIPRYEHDGFVHWKGQPYEAGVAEDIASFLSERMDSNCGDKS